MTPSQLDAVAKARAQLDEHFEGWVLVTVSELNDRQDLYDCLYHGGFGLAKGLLEVGRDKLRMPPDGTTTQDVEEKEDE